MTDHPRASVAITVAIIGFMGAIGGALIDRDKAPPPIEDISEIHTPKVKSVVQRAINLGADAYWNLDTSSLEKIFKDEAINLLRESVVSKKNQGIKIKNQSKEINFYNIDFQVDPLKAKVRFSRKLRTLSYSLENKHCIESTPEYSQEMTYYLQYYENGWKVVAIELHNSPPQERELC